MKTLLDAVRPTRHDDPERGDVPGWVLVTLVTRTEGLLGRVFQTG